MKARHLNSSQRCFRCCGGNLQTDTTTDADRRRQKINNFHKNSLEAYDTFMSQTMRREKREVTVEGEKIVSLNFELSEKTW